MNYSELKHLLEINGYKTACINPESTEAEIWINNTPVFITLDKDHNFKAVYKYLIADKLRKYGDYKTAALIDDAH